MSKVPTQLPDYFEGPGGLVLRRWRESDIPALDAAVDWSREHLSPWMPWAGQQLTPDERKAQLTSWDEQWRAGGDAFLGVFLDNAVAGGCGLHRRVAPDGLELGYWIHVDHIRRGLGTTVARLLIDGAFAITGTTHVEIHHDKANVASGAIPRRLGFELVAEEARERTAPGEVGIECRWRLRRKDWKKAQVSTRPSV